MVLKYSPGPGAELVKYGINSNKENMETVGIKWGGILNNVEYVLVGNMKPYINYRWWKYTMLAADPGGPTKDLDPLMLHLEEP